jgi:hypothetical protein
VVSEHAREDDRDDLARGMDSWQVEATGKMMSEYGHSYSSASGLATLMRDTLEASLRQSPPPLITRL